MKTYALVAGGRAIRCLVCGRTSWNQNDVAQRFCGYCKRFHADQAPAATHPAR